jgi:hypothetical protein
MSYPLTHDAERYARCIAISKRIAWDIEDDVIRGRSFDRNHRFLPDGLSLVDDLDFLSPQEQRWLSQIQGRTYANLFGLVERFINAKILDLSADYWLGDQTKLEALVRFSDEEIKHQRLFARIEALAAENMPAGYVLTADPNEVAQAVLGKSSWAVLALTLHIELFTQLHYRESIGTDPDLSPLFKDVFLFHWKEESQHAVIDELELRRCSEGLSAEELEQGVEDFIALVGALDEILAMQASADARYFSKTCGRTLSAVEDAAVIKGVHRAYRWQYILSGAGHPRFGEVLGELITPMLANRIGEALATLR